MIDMAKLRSIIVIYIIVLEIFVGRSDSQEDVHNGRELQTHRQDHRNTLKRRTKRQVWISDEQFHEIPEARGSIIPERTEEEAASRDLSWLLAEAVLRTFQEEDAIAERNRSKAATIDRVNHEKAEVSNESRGHQTFVASTDPQTVPEPQIPVAEQELRERKSQYDKRYRERLRMRALENPADSEARRKKKSDYNRRYRERIKNRAASVPQREEVLVVQRREEPAKLVGPKDPADLEARRKRKNEYNKCRRERLRSEVPKNSAVPELQRERRRKHREREKERLLMEAVSNPEVLLVQRLKWREAHQRRRERLQMEASKDPSFLETQRKRKSEYDKGRRERLRMAAENVPSILETQRKRWRERKMRQSERSRMKELKLTEAVEKNSSIFRF